MAGMSPPRVPAGARASRKRAAIVEAARVLLLRDGFEASMDAVAAEAGVSKVTVYHHFGAKTALFVAVVEDELDRALREPLRLVTSRLRESRDVRADLTAACRAWVAGLGSPEMLRLRNLVAGEVARLPELGTAWHTHGPQRFHPVVGDALRRLTAAGQLAVDDVEVAVLQLSGLVVSPTLVYGAYGRPLTKRLTERLVRAGVDMFLTYYGGGPS
jgi:TetR/AcrR family transcriptional repressor of mexJK operon